MKTVILLEANEIPRRLVEDHIARRPDGPLATLVQRSNTWVTECEDELELDPWISWPTLHRGVTDARHGIHHLGQSLEAADEKYPPIWRLLTEAGVDVGVFGSLHSSHVPPDAEQYAFYVPDYFAQEVYAHPASMLPFQQFNLVMTRRSARNVDTGVPAQETARFLGSAVRNGLRPATVGRVASQLVDERRDPVRKIRRRNVQAEIALDLFLGLLDRTRPQLATFYTNHVAASMHRYWAAHFPGDYPPEQAMPADWVARYSGEIPEAMDVFDRMVGRLVAWVDGNRHTELVLASSLGQAAVETGETRGFTTVTDTARFMDFLGLDRSDWTEGHAMVPCISVDVVPERVDEVVDRLEQLEFMGTQAVRSANEVAPLSFDVKDGRSVHLYFYFEGEEPEGKVSAGDRAADFDDAGFGFFVHEDNVACSAHHVRDGILAVYDPAAPAPTTRWEPLSTLEVAPALLRRFGVDVPEYMVQQPALAL